MPLLFVTCFCGNDYFGASDFWLLPSVNCFSEHSHYISWILSSHINCRQLKNPNIHNLNKPEAKQKKKKVVMKRATRRKHYYTSYLLHPPVLHLLLDYSHLVVAIEREWKREAFGTMLFKSTSIISKKHHCSWFEGCSLCITVINRRRKQKNPKH